MKRFVAWMNADTTDGLVDVLFGCLMFLFFVVAMAPLLCGGKQ